jgi:uncharacterized protein (TIGR02246 family)
MAVDRASVKTFFRGLADAWKTNDGGALAECFVEDGSLINPFGERADGRPAVAAMYAEYFKGLLSGTTTEVTVQTVRPVGADHAFVDGEQTIDGPDGETVLAVHVSALLRREHETWRMVDARPFTPAPSPQ